MQLPFPGHGDMTCIHTYVIVSHIGSVLTKASSVVHWHVTNHQFGFASRYIRLAMGKRYDPSSPAASNGSRTASAMILGLWQIWFITVSQCTFINDLATNSLRPSCQVTPHHKHKWPQQTLRDTHKHQWTPKQRKKNQTRLLDYTAPQSTTTVNYQHGNTITQKYIIIWMTNNLLEFV